MRDIFASSYSTNVSSGLGVMHSAAVGRGVAELLIHGRYQTLDLSPFSFHRVIRNEPLKELTHV